MPETLIPISFFLTAFGIVWVVITTRNRERMALIEKGLDASLLEGSDKEKKGRYGALKFGLLLIGFALGLLVGSLLETYTRMEEEVAYFSMIFLFGGLGLILYYNMVKDRQI